MCRYYREKHLLRVTFSKGKRNPGKMFLPVVIHHANIVSTELSADDFSRRKMKLGETIPIGCRFMQCGFMCAVEAARGNIFPGDFFPKENLSPGRYYPGRPLRREQPPEDIPTAAMHHAEPRVAIPIERHPPRRDYEKTVNCEGSR